MLAEIENLISIYDSELLEFFKQRNITSDMYIWPALANLFSDSLNRNEKLRLMDHLIIYGIRLMSYFSASYAILCKKNFLRCELNENIPVNSISN